MGLEPPKLHDIGPFLLRHRERIARGNSRVDLDRLKKISDWLQKNERDHSMARSILFPRITPPKNKPPEPFPMQLIASSRPKPLSNQANDQPLVPERLLSLITITILLVSGTWYFRKTERTFADVI